MRIVFKSILFCLSWAGPIFGQSTFEPTGNYQVEVVLRHFFQRQEGSRLAVFESHAQAGNLPQAPINDVTTVKKERRGSARTPHL